eukprot:4184101-Amphidinium_carterae.1
MGSIAKLHHNPLHESRCASVSRVLGTDCLCHGVLAWIPLSWSIVPAHACWFQGTCVIPSSGAQIQASSYYDRGGDHG